MWKPNGATLLNFDPTIRMLRRAGVTLALAVLIACVVALIDECAVALVFLPSWVALMMAWPYLSRKMGTRFSESRARFGSLPINGGRVLGTAVLACVLSVMLARMADAVIFVIAFFLLWFGLYFGWTYASRWLARFKTAPAAPAPRRPLWLRLIRGTLATVGGILLGLVCMGSLVFVPITLCEHRAQKVHDSIHVGMTVQEVLDTAKDCDVLSAGSEFPYDRNADGDNIPAMDLNWRRDGTYHTYDLAARQDVSLTETEAIERLHATLHDGYKWHFHYTYINMSPMHVSFSVVFGPDGRVSEVKPVYGWD